MKKNELDELLECRQMTVKMLMKLVAGDIAAIVGLKGTTTGNTLSDLNNPIILESITFPEPPVSIAIEPKTKADQEKMSLSYATTC